MMQYPELSFGQMMQKVAEHWRNLDPRDKEIYHECTFFDIDALDAQQFAQPRNFLFKFSDEFGISIFVDDGFADYLLGTVSVSGRGGGREPIKDNAITIIRYSVSAGILAAHQFYGEK